mgnify:CR=1 FL=1
MDIDLELTWAFTWVTFDYSDNTTFRQVKLFRKHEWEFTDAAIEAYRQYREESEVAKPERAGDVPRKSVYGYARLSQVNARAYKSVLVLPTTKGVGYNLVKPIKNTKTRG